MNELKAIPGPYTWAKYSKKRFGIGPCHEEAFALVQPIYVDADDEEMRATMRLMAVAWDMYQEIKYHLEMTRLMPNGEQTADFKRMDALLKKARGEA